MKFLHKQYQAKKKEILEVEIDRPTKIKFMTAFDFKHYKLGKTNKYFGGLFEESPVRFVVPFDSVWHIVVEKGSHYQPIEVQGRCRLLLPERGIRSSVASDAPAHVRDQAALDASADRGSDTSEAMSEQEGRGQA